MAIANAVGFLGLLRSDLNEQIRNASSDCPCRKSSRRHTESGWGRTPMACFIIGFLGVVVSVWITGETWLPELCRHLCGHELPETMNSMGRVRKPQRRLVKRKAKHFFPPTGPVQNSGVDVVLIKSVFLPDYLKTKTDSISRSRPSASLRTSASKQSCASQDLAGPNFYKPRVSPGSTARTVGK